MEPEKLCDRCHANPATHPLKGRARPLEWICDRCWVTHCALMGVGAKLKELLRKAGRDPFIHKERTKEDGDIEG